MAEYPRLTQSPFFRTFTGKNPPLMRRPSPMGWRQSEAQRRFQKEAQARELKNYPLMAGLLSQPGPQQAFGVTNDQSASPEQQHAPPLPAEPAELDPRQAAERIMKINQGLPDGVRFEPMDDEVMTAMRGLSKEAPAPKPGSHLASPAPPPTPAKQKKLPDGVRYEPLDDETMALLKKMGKDIPSPAAPELQATSPPSVSPPESAKLLENLIQDERNSSVFYQYLSGIAPSGSFRDALQKAAKDCDNHCIQYQQMLENLYNRDYKPKNTAVNTNTGFDRGVEMAVLEEKKILESMTNLIDHLENEAGSYTLQNLLNKRMIRLNWLQWAMFKGSAW